MPDFRKTFVKFFQRLNWHSEDIAKSLDLTPSVVLDYLVRGDEIGLVDSRFMHRFGISLSCIAWITEGDVSKLPEGIRAATNKLAEDWVKKYEDVMAENRIEETDEE